MRWQAIKTFFEKLGDGNLVAWCFVFGFLALAGLLIFVGWRMRKAHQREDEDRKNRWLKKPKPKQ